MLVLYCTVLEYLWPGTSNPSGRSFLSLICGIIIGYAVLMTGCAPEWGSLCPWQSLRVQIQKAPAHRFFSTSTEQTSINSDWKRFSLFVGACLGHLVVNFYLPCLSSLFFLFLSSLIVHQRCLLCSLLRSQKYSQASPFPFPHRLFFFLICPHYQAIFFFFFFFF